MTSPLQPECRALRASVRIAIAVALVAVLSVGCSTTSVVDSIPSKVGGLPEGTPERREVPLAYPAVNAMPPERERKILTDDERKRLEAELAAARARQAKRAAPPPQPPDDDTGQASPPSKKAAARKKETKATAD